MNAKLTRDFAFYISDSVQKHSLTTENGVEINLYHYSSIDNPDELLKLAATALEYFGEKITTYPFAQLDIVETGMPSATCVASPEMVMMDSDSLKKSGFYKMLVYSVGRQWFYNMIGNNKAAAPWLDEGLSLLLTDRLLLGDELPEEMETERLALYKRTDAVNRLRLADNMGRFERWEDYYNIQQIKAKLMVYSLMETMGEEKFDIFLKQYGATYAFCTVDANGLLETANNAYGDDLSALFSEWIDGYGLPPLVGVNNI